jgi:hypothetical protein
MLKERSARSVAFRLSATVNCDLSKSLVGSLVSTQLTPARCCVGLPAAAPWFEASRHGVAASGRDVVPSAQRMTNRGQRYRQGFAPPPRH